MRKWKFDYKEHINGLNDSGDLCFVLLLFFALPSLYFVIAGSDWPVWKCIPDKYVYLLVNGDSTLYEIGLAHLSGFMFYIMVDYWPMKRRIKNDTRSFLIDVQQYMFKMEMAISRDIDEPEAFYKKLYSLPKEPVVFYKRKKWLGILRKLYENHFFIEGSYNVYRQYANYKYEELTDVHKQNLNDHKKRLEEYKKIYRECANEMSDILGLTDSIMRKRK